MLPGHVVRLVPGPTHSVLAGWHHLEMHQGLMRRYGSGRRDLDCIGKKLTYIVDVAGRVDQQHAVVGE